MAIPILTAAADPAAVLTKAFLRAGEYLGQTRRYLAGVVGVSEASLSRLGSGRLMSPDTKEGELALLFLRMFRSLDSLFGGNAEQCRIWFEADNVHLGGVPRELVRSVGGLVHVADYLDAMRS